MVRLILKHQLVAEVVLPLRTLHRVLGFILLEELGIKRTGHRRGGGIGVGPIIGLRDLHQVDIPVTLGGWARTPDFADVLYAHKYSFRSPRAGSAVDTVGAHVMDSRMGICTG